MPILAFLVAAGTALLVLLFVADAMLEKGSLPIGTSRVGLPERWHSDTVQVLTAPPAPAPDMTSPAVRAAQPKSYPDALAKLAPDGAARAEVPSENNRFSRPMSYRQGRWGDKLSIGGQ